MKRDFFKKLLSWKASDMRKPLVLRGARQVGKTYLLKEFTKEYDNHIYVNFDEEPHFASFFAEDLKPERIIKELGIYFKEPILPGKTLIIFDEIQECPEALNSLKYFCEKKNEYHVATAGSLLGVKLSKGFPVGKVNFLDLAPLSFFEFLDALGESSLRKLIEEIEEPKKISDIFHEKLLKLLKYYFIIGGMPEAVATYLKKENLEDVRIVQKEILDAYTLDFAKHAPEEEVMKIMAVWESIPRQLAKENKKFIFSAIRESARAKNYETAIQWLKDAGLLIKANLISTPKLPLDAYADKRAFKVYMLDVGLLGAMSKLDPRVLLEGNQLFQEFKGALTENYVATQLHDHHFDSLYYWSSEGIAEVDFVISTQQLVFPLEVKAGTSKQKRSLLVYEQKFSQEENSPPVLSRTTLRNFAYEAAIINYPLYAISLFPLLYRKRIQNQ
ncbi:MAG: ATP-binding protein [Rhabdochlamydiaceae bacterium]|jgi:predicted AAA+ superfamily ATPase